MLQKTSIADQRDGSRDDLATSITAIPASIWQRDVALGVFIFLVVIAAINAPFSLIPLGPAHSFIPVIQGVMSTANLLTAIFLLVQYSLYPQRALLVLAGGFVFSGLFALLHTLAFPSAHAAAVQIGDKVNSPPWLFAFWHITFALAVIIYALSKDAGKPINQSGLAIRANVGVTIGCVVMITGALTWVATAGVGYLPPLHDTQMHRTSFALHVSAFALVLNGAALAVLFVRRHTLLDQWLMVTLVAWLPQLMMQSLFTDLRFNEGWYLSRAYALFAGSSLLVVLLTETLLLHRRYERHQRQLIAELDHRVKNVLAQVDGIVISMDQGSRSIEDFNRAFRGRIQSMAAAHSLLSERSWHSVALDNLVLIELAPYATGANVKITGTDVMLSSAETQALAKVLHELATNAAKYGALSIPSGEVSVSWDRKPNGQKATLIGVAGTWRSSGVVQGSIQLWHTSHTQSHSSRTRRQGRSRVRNRRGELSDRDSFGTGVTVPAVATCVETIDEPIVFKFVERCISDIGFLPRGRRSIFCGERVTQRLHAGKRRSRPLLKHRNVALRPSACGRKPGFEALSAGQGK